MTLVQWLAVWFIVAVAIAPFIGNLLHKRRWRQQSAECAKLEKLCELADEYEAAPTDAARKRIFIKAEALGFTDGAFALDPENHEHPTLPKAS